MTEKITLHVEGMTCASCVSRVEKSLLSVKGVNEASVNLLMEKAKVEYDSTITTQDKLIIAIENSGYKASIPENQQNKKLSLSIDGMHCANCSRIIETNLNKVDGIEYSKVVLTTNTAEILYDEDKIETDFILKSIENLGYNATILEDIRAKEQLFSENKQLKDMRKRFLWSLILALPVFIFAMGHMLPFSIWFPKFANWQMVTYIFPGMKFSHFLQFILTTPIQFLISYPFYRGAWKSLKNKSASMDVLVVLGTSAAYIYSLFALVYPYFVPDFVESQVVFFETSAILLTFIFLGKYLEEVTKGKTSEAIRKLVELRPETATILRNNIEVEIPIDDVRIKDICLIRPGESIPVDGKVIDGESYINESMITGESISVFKEKDSELIGGTINENGFLKMETTRIGSDTTLNKIIKMVEDAQTSKIPIQKLADRISAVFVPAVIILSLLSFVVWFSLFSFGLVDINLLPSGTSTFLFAFLIAIAVLVISCPCALGLATPTAIMVGTGLGAQNGILIKSGEALEKSRDVDVVLFDKTGTITSGSPIVTDIKPLIAGLSEKELLQIVASMEKGSEHSIAKAILLRAKEEDTLSLEMTNFQAFPGKGIKASLENDFYLFGNRKLAEDNKIDLMVDTEPLMENLENDGKTVMFLSKNSQMVGLLAISDTIKEFSRESIDYLKRKNILVGIVSGDNKRAVKSIASQVGISEIHAEVLPEDKLNIVKEYQDQGKSVAFVGDGINDAPALAQSNIGIAIGSGTDVAIESADFVLVKDDLRDVVTAIDLSEKTIRRVKMGLFWALFYNSIAIPLAAGVFFLLTGNILPAEVAGLAMAFSSVSVVTNALLLKRYKNPFISKRKNK